MSYNIAVIITGDIRDKDTFDMVKSQFNRFDIFCGSYVKHSDLLEDFGKSRYLCLIDPNNDIYPPNNIPKENMQQNMLQWLHLNNLISNYKSQLVKYDIVLKYRFDTIIKGRNDYFSLLSTIQNIKENHLYNQSDLVFFAEPNTFIKLFENFYHQFISATFPHKNSYDGSFEKSWKSEPSFLKNMQHHNVVNANLPFVVEIIRGKYKKETADGNKKLYRNNTMYGKFS